MSAFLDAAVLAVAITSWAALFFAMFGLLLVAIDLTLRGRRALR